LFLDLGSASSICEISGVDEEIPCRYLFSRDMCMRVRYANYSYWLVGWCRRRTEVVDEVVEVAKKQLDGRMQEEGVEGFGFEGVDDALRATLSGKGPEDHHR
jgi:hypothetical protein